MDDQERLARALEEIQNAAREVRVSSVVSLVLKVVASNPSPPRVRREQSASTEPPRR